MANTRSNVRALAPRTGDGEQGRQQNGWLAVAQRRGRDPAQLRARYAHRRIGDILVMLGLLSREDRDAVLTCQAEMALPFGECCRFLNLVGPEDLTQALAWQFGYLHPVSGSFSFGRDLVMVSEPFGPYAEALRAAAGRLITRWLAPGRNRIAVASAEPGDGRSHVAANLAVAMAQAGQRTLLIDADLRRPRQHRIFDIPLHPGLSRLLCGFAPRDVVRPVPHLRLLSLITAGPRPPNPLELLGRGELREFLGQASDYYDVVLVDTPAGSRRADAECIAAAAGDALLVVRRGRTRQRLLAGFTKDLKGGGVNIVGTLMNL